MNNMEFYLQLITVLFGGAGIWKLIEVLIRLRPYKKLRNAEAQHVQVQTESQIVKNWIEWSKELEKRIDELEEVAKENKELKVQIENQRKRICELENKVQRVELENQQLRNQLKGLSNKS